MQMPDYFKGVAWNIFLAAVPVALAYVIYWLANRSRTWPSKVAVFLVGLVWLAFLPNTCYLLTEWRHLLFRLAVTDLAVAWVQSSSAAVALATYTIFYFCYSMAGMVAFVLAVRPVARIMRNRGADLRIWAIPLFLAMSVGVYLGLVLRFNSWGFLLYPQEIWDSVTEIGTRPALAAFIVAFAGVLWVSYFALDVWVDGFIHRLREWRKRGGRG